MEKSVPPKEEVIIEVELTVPQKQYYRAIYEQNTAFLGRGGTIPSLANMAMELRKCCNHTYLVSKILYYSILYQTILLPDHFICSLMSKLQVIQKFFFISIILIVIIPQIKGAEIELLNHFQGESSVDIMVKCSGKLVLLDKLLPKLRADGHRVLIFSQFRMMLEILEEYLVLRGYTFGCIDGCITGTKRQLLIDRYGVGGDTPIQI